MSVVMSGCLDSDDTYEFSSDATLHAFAIDTIYGVDYTFTIDQLNRLIYNRDSLPVSADTLIDSIMITTMTVTGWVTSGSPTDTILDTSKALDLRPAMNTDNGIKFKVHAADGISICEYTLKVNVHQQDPDSLVWTDMQTQGNIFSETVNEGEQKAVILKDALWVYASNTTAYTTSTAPDNYRWSEASVTGLPADVRLTSILTYGDALYAVTDSHKAFTSADGFAWEEVTTLSDNVITLINGFTDRLSGIVEMGGKRYFNISKDGKHWEEATDEDGNVLLEEVPADFPVENISTTRSYTGNGVEKVILAGMPLANEKETVPWFSLDGKGWASLASTAYDTYCPGMTNPAIMYYGGTYYCFGGGMDAIYQSVAGIAWYKTEKKFLLPESFKEKGAYSVIVEPTTDKTVPAADKRDFIWVVFGGNGAKNEVWRGRLNKLGFEIQD